MAVGLTYGQAQDIPLGELLDYMAIYQIKHEDFEPRRHLTDDDIIPDVR